MAGIYGGFIEFFPELYEEFTVTDRNGVSARMSFILVDTDFAGIDPAKVGRSSHYLDIADHQLAYVPVSDYVHEGYTFVDRNRNKMKFVQHIQYDRAAGYDVWRVERVQQAQEGRIENVEHNIFY